MPYFQNLRQRIGETTEYVGNRMGDAAGSAVRLTSKITSSEYTEANYDKLFKTALCAVGEYQKIVYMVKHKFKIDLKTIDNDEFVKKQNSDTNFTKYMDKWINPLITLYYIINDIIQNKMADRLKYLIMKKNQLSSDRPDAIVKNQEKIDELEGTKLYLEMTKNEINKMLEIIKPGAIEDNKKMEERINSSSANDILNALGSIFLVLTTSGGKKSSTKRKYNKKTSIHRTSSIKHRRR